jgi:hypothetical protein
MRNNYLYNGNCVTISFNSNDVCVLMSDVFYGNNVRKLEVKEYDKRIKFPIL